MASNGNELKRFGIAATIVVAVIAIIGLIVTVTANDTKQSEAIQTTIERFGRHEVRNERQFNRIEQSLDKLHEKFDNLKERRILR